MRLGKTDGEKERLSLLAQFSDGLCGETRGLAVGVEVISDIAGFEGYAFAFVLHVFLHSVSVGGILGVGRRLGRHPRRGPGRFVVEAAVEDLTHALGEVAVLLEVLADGLDVGKGDAEVRLKIPDAGGVGALAGHD